MKHSITILILGLLLQACMSSHAPKEVLFSKAVEDLQQGSYKKSARYAWSFLSNADQDDPRYDRGLRLLARSAEGLELKWAAAMLYRQIAKARRNMELVPEAVAGIERIIDSGVYDEDAMIASFLASEEFSSLPVHLRAFVDYYKGLDLARRGFDAWSNGRFAKIPEESPYWASGRYVKAVRYVARGNYDRAVRALFKLRGKENISPKLRMDVERSLARIAFEEQRYHDAIIHFETLRELAPDDPEILLEMAWTYYYIGDSRKALGLLIALDAPVHKDYISPERYLLEALSLRRLCQFGAARQAITRLEKKHGDTLKLLSAGRLPNTIPQLIEAASLRGVLRNNSRLKEAFKKEMAILKDLESSFGDKLFAFMEAFYKEGFQEIEARQRELINDELTNLTEELLAAHQGVQLIVHELSVSLLRGRRRPEGAVEKPMVEVPITGDKVYYPFYGEYWTDELDDLLVIAEDRCIE